MFQNPEWSVSVQTTALSQGIRQLPTSYIRAISKPTSHSFWERTNTRSGRWGSLGNTMCSLCRTHWRKAIPLWNQQMQFEFQTLSSEERADSSRLTLGSSSMDHTQADSHTPGSPATLVKGSYQLLREGPLGAEASMHSMFFTLCHP